MKQRDDGRWVRKITVDKKQVFFYSSEPTEKKAIKDIEKQLLNYKHICNNYKNNFKTLADRMIEYKIEKVGYKCVETYLTALKKLEIFYTKDIQDIKANEIQNLLQNLADKKYSKSTIQKVKITLNLIYKYAIQNDLEIYNPMPNITLPRCKENKKSAISDKDIKIINNNVSHPFGKLVKVLLYTGLRRSEILPLEPSAIDFENNLIYINKVVVFQHNQPIVEDRTKTPCGVRNVPILEPIKPLLLDLTKTKGYLWGELLTETKVKKRWNKYCRDVGIDITMHQLRHTYAKMLYRAEVDPKTAQGLLGHADISTTMNIYTDFSKDVTEKAVDKINDFVSNL